MPGTGVPSFLVLRRPMKYGRSKTAIRMNDAKDLYVPDRCASRP